MAPLRVGYVREHFASPLLQFAENDKGETFTLTECPGGTGQLIKALADDQVDLVMYASTRFTRPRISLQH